MSRFYRFFTAATIACAVMLCLTACDFHISINGNPLDSEPNKPIPEQLTVADFVIGNPYGLSTIYISEDGCDIPYLVISDDYDGHCLLMRQNVLSEKLAFREGSAVYNESRSYYPGSTVDLFLSQTFPERFSESVRAVLTESNVEVMTEEAVWLRENKTEIIKRKCFLLSATEAGVGYHNPYQNGKEISGLEDYSVPEPNWLRTAYHIDDVTVWMICTEGAGTAIVSEELYVRPVMTMDGSTEVTAGKEEQGYRLACDMQSTE